MKRNSVKLDGIKEVFAVFNDATWEKAKANFTRESPFYLYSGYTLKDLRENKEILLEERRILQKRLLNIEKKAFENTKAGKQIQISMM